MATIREAISSGCTIRAFCSSGTLTGRSSRIGVLISPGKMLVMRIPFPASSALMAEAMPETPNLEVA